MIKSAKETRNSQRHFALSSKAFCPRVGQNGLIFKLPNSVIVLNPTLFIDLSVRFVNSFVSFNRKVYSELDRMFFRIMVKSFLKEGGGGGGGGGEGVVDPFYFKFSSRR